MAVRRQTVKEYIGARYVPLFYDDGNGGAEWTNTVQYEPLTIVTHEGNSYTSRQYVPVGVSINNTRYWLETGNWNSQVEQYREEVFTFDDRITANADAITAEATARANADTEINDRITSAVGAERTARIAADDAIRADMDADFNNSNPLASFVGGIVLGFGDSILYGRFCEDPTTESPLAILADDLGMTAKNYAVNHGAFGRSSATGYRIRDQINDAIADSSFNHDNVRLCILEGGVNDANDNAGSSTIVAEVRGCLQALKQYFPAAKILVLPVLQGCMGFSFYPSQNRYTIFSAIVEACRAENVGYARKAFQWGIGRAAWAADQLHPNIAGSAGYGHAITQELTGTPYTYDVTIASPATSAFEPVSDLTGHIRAFDGRIELCGTWSCVSAFSAGDTLLRLPAWCCYEKNSSIPIPAMKNYSGTWTPIMLTMKTELLDIQNGTSGVTLRTSSQLEAGASVWIPPYSFAMGM